LDDANEISKPVPPISFEVRGTYCANPWSYAEGSDFVAAEANAEEMASQKCYPSTASAQFKCVR
jgi:hypothetical protein